MKNSVGDVRFKLQTVVTGLNQSDQHKGGRKIKLVRICRNRCTSVLLSKKTNNRAFWIVCKRRSMEKRKANHEEYPNKPEAKTDNSVGNHFGEGFVDKVVYSCARSERTN